MPWLLQRSPLAPGVPLEGSETVQGLRALERLRLAELLAAPGSPTAAGGVAPVSTTGWRRNFQRYRGPYIEQLSSDDLQRPPKDWRVFWQGNDRGQLAPAYTLPASLDVLRERTEENFVSFLPNYLRLAAAVILATFYLRPRALLGGAAVALTSYRTWRALLERQRLEALASAEAAAAGGRNGRQQQQAAAAQVRAASQRTQPDEQAANAVLTLVTWLVVAYTRCMPILVLGCCAALVAVLLHSGLRRAASEYRYRGRQPLGYTWGQVLGREPVPLGSHPRALFREMAIAARQAAALSLRRARLYCRYYTLTAMDNLRLAFKRR